MLLIAAESRVGFELEPRCVPSPSGLPRSVEEGRATQVSRCCLGPRSAKNLPIFGRRRPSSPRRGRGCGEVCGRRLEIEPETGGRGREGQPGVVAAGPGAGGGLAGVVLSLKAATAFAGLEELLRVLGPHQEGRFWRLRQMAMGCRWGRQGLSGHVKDGFSLTSAEHQLAAGTPACLEALDSGRLLPGWLPCWLPCCGCTDPMTPKLGQSVRDATRSARSLASPWLNWSPREMSPRLSRSRLEGIQRQGLSSEDRISAGD